MTIRLEVDEVLNCRAKRGERRDKHGRMVRCQIYRGATLAECIADAEAGRVAAEELAPGYTAVIECRVFPEEAFRAARGVAAMLATMTHKTSSLSDLSMKGA